MTNEKPVNTPDIGAHLKEARRRRDLRLQQVSDLSGVSVSTISKIENGKVSASFDTLLALSHALDISFDALFQTSPQGPSGRRAITHASDSARFATDQYSYEVHAQELSSKRMIPLVMEIKSRGIDKSTKWSQHSGEEFIFVITGELDLYTEAYAPTRLAGGESAYIDSGMPHAFVSVSLENARIISVCLDTAAKTAEAFVSSQTRK